MLFSPIIILQLYCAYHIYTNRQDTYWYFVVFLLPLLGSVIYLFLNVFGKMNVDDVTTSIKDIFKEDPVLDKLKNELTFSDTTKNRLNYVNALLERERGRDAEQEYRLCLRGAYADDPSILIKLLQALHIQNRHQEAVDIGNQLTSDPLFRNSKERISYALSLGQVGKNEEAVKEFDQMNTRYSNYEHRLAYVQFLKSIGEDQSANSLLEVLTSEIDQMNSTEKRINREVVKRIKMEIKS